MRESFRALAAACLVAASGLRAHASQPPPPSGLVDVVAGGESITLWPYTTSDLESPSDPINLLFPNADPRGIRQALLKLDGTRPAFATLPGGGCTRTDAMGNEHAAWADPAGFVGGAVQLACIAPGAPLGSPFRFHIRLFRSGAHTIGNAHYEFLIPGTAEHEVLSWDLARELAAFDVGRTGRLTEAPGAVGMILPGSHRAVRRPVFQALAAAGAGPLLAALGLVLPPAGDIPIPTSGVARARVGELDVARESARETTATEVQYSIVVPKPFCATGPFDFVKLEGPVDLAMTVETDGAGTYERRYSVSGALTVTPMTPTSPTTLVASGDSVAGIVVEQHRARLDDRHGQVSETGAQVLLGDPKQSMRWRLAAGQSDRFARQILCGE
jgi:hypothetical protein